MSPHVLLHRQCLGIRVRAIAAVSRLRLHRAWRQVYVGRREECLYGLTGAPRAFRQAQACICRCVRPLQQGLRLSVRPVKRLPLPTICILHSLTEIVVVSGSLSISEERGRVCCKVMKSVAYLCELNVKKSTQIAIYSGDAINVENVLLTLFHIKTLILMFCNIFLPYMPIMWRKCTKFATIFLKN